MSFTLFSIHSEYLYDKFFLGTDHWSLGCRYEWCHDIPQIHMVQFFLQYYISVIAFPFCTTMTASVFSCVLGDIPQVSCQYNENYSWLMNFSSLCYGGTWAILSINFFLGVLVRNVDPMWKPVTRSWSYSGVICLRKTWNILVIRDCDRGLIIFFVTSFDYIPKAKAQNHQGT